MDLEERVILTTPEGLTVELALAGPGSRFAAALLDWLVRGVVFVALMIVGSVSTAVAILGGFVVLFGYDVVFEVAAGGRTPGKRWTGLRVVDAAGGPVRLIPSAIRNLLRLVDFLPAFYLVAIVTIVASRRNQRLGDIVAGTLVVRERTSGPIAATGRADVSSWAPAPARETAGGAPGWDVASVTAEELATVRRFLERRADLLPEARSRLAQELATRLRPKVSSPLAGGHPEEFLEGLVAAKDGTWS